jgi:hypothetical protein
MGLCREVLSGSEVAETVESQEDQQLAFEAAGLINKYGER